MADNYQKLSFTNKSLQKSESELWLEFKGGNEKSLSKIFYSLYSDLYNYSYRLCKDDDLAKDSIQNLFIGLWKNKENLGQVTSVKFYLIKSLRRSLLRNMAKKKKYRFEFDIFTSIKPDVMFSQEEILITEENTSYKKEMLAKLLNELPKRQKEAIYLKFYDDLSYEEIADLMGLNYQSVVNHIHKAFKLLRKNNSGLSAASEQL